MRIGPGIVLPPTPVPAASALAAISTPDRSILFRTAALAASAPLPPLVATADATAAATLPIPIADAPLLAAIPPASPGAALAALIRSLPPPPDAVPAAANPLLAGSSPAASPTQATPGPAPRLDTSAVLPAADRLTLSTAASSLSVEPSQLPKTPAGQFALDLLESLTGEPRSSLQFLEPGARDPVGAGYLALAAKNADALLSLLLQGSVRTADDRRLDLSFRLSVQRPPDAEAPDLATRVEIRAALEQLAQLKHVLDYPGPAARLAGQSLRFEAAFDPRVPWALPSFYLSGHLLLGFARDPESWEVAEEDDTEERNEQPTDDDDTPPQEAPPRRKRKPKPSAEDEITPLPADGGLPIISARRWLELEMRHLRRQLRLWMLLPPTAPA